MAWRIFELTYRTARALNALFEGVPTTLSSDSSSLVDMRRLANEFPDDYFTRGTVWVYGAAGSGGWGQVSRVSGFISTAGMLMFDTISGTPDPGGQYAVADKRYPFDQIKAKIDDALQEISIEVIDETITTTRDTLEYDLPFYMLDDRIEVWIRGVASTTGAANDWARLHDWYLRPARSGATTPAGMYTGPKLIFRTQPPYPYTLRIHYWVPNTPQDASGFDNKSELMKGGGVLRETVAIDRVIFDAAARLLEWRRAQPGEVDPELDKQIAAMTARAERAKWRSPVKLHANRKLNSVGYDERYEY